MLAAGWLGNVFAQRSEPGFPVAAGLSEAERSALGFLYDYMSLGDAADYDSAFYVANVRSAFQARTEMPWGMSVPEREFRHFVLPVRVNNENLDSSRQVFYRELKPRVRHLSMYEAVLEVNHWCHEKAVYTPSDARTSSPLATVRTAYGRCGEESVFLVAALRSVGIPARQVYTPRWAHTDDNHAWVEAWVDGTWYFLGACEPEPVLNLAWFNEPASRGMLMHTKVFGHYDGPEEVIGRTPCYTEINVIGQYAPVGKLKVRVLEADGKAAGGVKIEFKLYNYAEFFTVAAHTTDENGEAELTAGKGDMLVWASKGDRFGFAKAAFGRDSLVEIELDRRVGDEFALDFDMEPPVATAQAVAVTPAQRAANDRRLQTEDSIRNAYTATFATEEEALRRLDFLADTSLRRLAAGFLAGGRGNQAVLQAFLAAVPAPDAGKAVRLLSVISDKDLRDIEPAVLQDHFAHTPPYAEAIGEDTWARYVLNPRVRYERLTPYKRYFQENLPDTLKMRICDDPVWFAAYCMENLRLQP
ncbi:MAG: transglutaminase-like domain-containing protein, partial [Bacteroidales bacterium]|nr:transglutaminase-like domain-containing protein [Bacteroidales bacterium]